ncbi:hypothetical protein I553_6545 [Mycobacterium xenopi 4042]|uniref:Peptidase S8/S53 domain-containing protein n=1 Tax=Mycobacterium xenopi 4042 TaxID=1299334 RepID=X8BHZ2_MYCXE|nr:hypothetical protein I553_6545 [Mycobacterium xenopi 4042]
MMAGGDGLSDCDAHGTMVASMIAAAPATGAAAEAPAAGPACAHQRAATTTSAAADDHHVGTSPPPQTITMVPARLRRRLPLSSRRCRGCPTPKAPGAVNRGHGSVTAPSYSGGRRIVVADRTQPASRPASTTAAAPMRSTG